MGLVYDFASWFARQSYLCDAAAVFISDWTVWVLTCLLAVSGALVVLGLRRAVVSHAADGPVSDATVVGCVGHDCGDKDKLEAHPECASWSSTARFPARGWWGALAIVLLSVGLALGVSPHNPQVFFDEINIYDLARNLSEIARFVVVPQFEAGPKVVPIPPAWPYVLSLGFLWRGGEYSVISLLSLVFGIAAPVAAFWCGWSMFGRVRAALLLGVLVSVLPIHLRVAGSGALENGSLTLLIVFTACLYRWRDSHDGFWIWSASLVAAWLMNWRMENPVVILPSLLVALGVSDSRFLRLAREWRFYAGVFLALLLASPGLVCDVYGMARHYYLFYNNAEVLQTQVAENCVHNWLYWLENNIHPLWITVAALVGVVFWKPWREGLAWFSWFLLLVFFYSRIPSADFSLLSTIDSWRNALHPAWALLVVVAGGVTALEVQLEAYCGGNGRWPLLLRRPLTLFVVGCCLFTPWCFRGFVTSDSVFIREFNFIRDCSLRMPENANLLFDGPPALAMYAENRERSLEYASGRVWRIVNIFEENFQFPGVGASPQLLRDVATWNGNGSRIFLYYLSVNNDSWNVRRRDWLDSMFDMRLVAGVGHAHSHTSMELYEIDSISVLGKEWLENGPGAPIGPW